MSGASRLYDRFRGREPGRAFSVGVKFGRTWITDPGRVNLIIPAELAVMGHVAGIAYDTTRDGKILRAEHTFEPGSRPLLVAGPGNGQVFLLGTRFRWTDRGIMDIDARGRLISDPKGLPRV